MMKKLLDYFLEINKIKDVKRYSPYHKVFTESVADHSFMMVVLAIKFIDELKLDLNFKKVVQLITHHDFCEIGLATDYDAVKASADKNYQAEKETFENKNMEELAARHGKEILNLYMEYIRQETREARFVKALDKLEANVYEMMRGPKYFTDAPFIATYSNKAVRNFPELIPFLRELQTYMKREYEAAGLTWKDEYSV